MTSFCGIIRGIFQNLRYWVEYDLMIRRRVQNNNTRQFSVEHYLDKQLIIFGILKNRVFDDCLRPIILCSLNLNHIDK